MIALASSLAGWRLGVSLGLILTSATLAASTHPVWVARAWQSGDGLPDNCVTGIAQLPEGYLWVSTPSGVARFDGMRFEKLTSPKVPSLVRAMCLGHKGGLWLATTAGRIVWLDGHTVRVFTRTNGLPDLIAHTLVEDNQGTLWIAYHGGSICRLKEGKVTRITERDGLPAGQTCSLARDALGRIWFCREGYVGMFRDGRAQSLARLDNNPATRMSAARAGGVWICAGLRLFRCDERAGLEEAGEFHSKRPAPAPRAVLEDRSGAVWIGTTTGLFRYDRTGFESIPTSERQISILAEDFEGDLWVGTWGGGLNRVRPRAVELEGAEAGLPFDAVISICEDTQGILWATTQNRLLARRGGGKWSMVSSNLNWAVQRPTCVTADHAGAVWIGTDNGALHCWCGERLRTWRRAEGLASEVVRALLVASNGDLWIGETEPDGLQCLRDGKLRSFQQPPGSGTIRTMAEDALGSIWAATSKGALLRVRGQGLTDETSRTSGSHKVIRCLCARPDGSLWMGYGGWGLGLLKDGHFARVSAEQGLYDNSISQIVADDQGWLWFGAQHGIFKARQQDLEAVAEGRSTRVQSIHYGPGEGLRSLQANIVWSPGVLRSRDGRLWFPMRTGLAVVQPQRLTENLRPPPVLLKRVAVDNRSVAWHGAILSAPDAAGRDFPDPEVPGTTLILQPSYRKLEFEFAVLSFVSPENIDARYRLDGFDADWIEAGTQRRVTYSRLPEGDYRFRVSACNNDGVWNENGAALAFTVRPFLWQTWWFRFGSLALFTGAVVAIVRYVSLRRLRSRVRVLQQQDALHKDRARIAKDLHDDLGASLTQIALLSELAQGDFDRPEQAKVHLNEVFNTAHSLTRALDMIVWAVSPRNDTLDRFVEHLATFAPAFLRPAGVHCRLDVPVKLPSIALAPDLRHNLYFAAKETLNNIVKHACASEVWLRVAIEDDTLILVVEDNGKGFRPDEPIVSERDGLVNLRQRMKEIGGVFEQRSGSGCGTVTRFRVSLERKSHES